MGAWPRTLPGQEGETMSTTSLIPRAPSRIAQTGVSIPRQTQRKIKAIEGRTIEAAARIHAATYVTHVAQTHVVALSAEEGRLIQFCPLAEPRLKAIGDTFAGVACAEIAGLTT